MVPTVRRGQGKSGSFKKSGKVRENGEGQGKSGNFITVARKKSIIVFSIYILALNLTSEMSDFKAKMYQIQFRLGLCPRPRWRSLQCCPRPV